MLLFGLPANFKLAGQSRHSAIPERSARFAQTYMLQFIEVACQANLKLPRRQSTLPFQIPSGQRSLMRMRKASLAAKCRHANKLNCRELAPSHCFARSDKGMTPALPAPFLPAACHRQASPDPEAAPRGVLVAGPESSHQHLPL